MFSKIRISKKSGILLFFYIFANPFNIGVKTSKLDFHICYSIRSVATGWLEYVKKKMASHRYIDRKGRDTLILLSDN